MTLTAIACQLDLEHLNELQQGSAIDPGIIELNFKSLNAQTPYEYLCYSDQLPRTNTGRLNKWVIDLLAHTEAGGWWCNGLDPLNDWQPMAWGCFKPNQPRHERPKGFDPTIETKAIKYEHPLKTPTRAFFLNIPQPLWEKIATRYDIPILESEREAGFWQWVWTHRMPIILTEGAKKAACLLSQGFIAIALPGISMGYRAIRDENDLVVARQLIPELQHFATLGREFYFAFDYETKPKTIKAVQINLAITAQRLAAAGCTVRIINLPGPEKGVDDFIVAHGGLAFEHCFHQAQSLEQWQAQQHYQLTYPVAMAVERRYLGDVPYPESGLALVKSPKDTGKTTALENRIRAASQSGQRVLVISHRIQLCRGICAKLGINYVEDIRKAEDGSLLGIGLCIDSLHPKSQARFNPQDWKGAIVILDEIEQIIWHVLNSTTCYSHRVVILQSLKELLQVVFTTGGLVIAQDADLSDISIDFLTALPGFIVEPWLLVNSYRYEQQWQVSYYETKNPSMVIAKMADTLRAGQAVYICLDAQKAKSKWGSKNLEKYLRKQFPKKRILRIDSETVANPKHKACGIIEHINDAITDYDIVIATPSLGTGISIDVKGHFGAVFGIFQGAIADSEIRQALARIRDTIPRHVWAKCFSSNRVGNGCLNYRDILHSTQTVVRRTIKMLQTVDFDIDAASDPISLRTWAKLAARVNASMTRYRESLRLGLLREGHQVQVITDDPDPGTSETIKEQLTQVREHTRTEEAQAIADAEDITPAVAHQLQNKRGKTPEERYQKQKHDLHHRYGIEVTPDLQIKDEDGWHPQLRLHYYLNQDPQLVRDRDQKHLEGHIERGNGQVALQDIRLYTAQVETLKLLNIPDFWDPERELRKTDSDLQQFCTLAKRYRKDIKRVLGFTIHADANPIQVLGMFLTKLGMKLECIKRERNPDGSRCRVYQYVEPDDGRESVFQAWVAKEDCGPHLDSKDQIINSSGLQLAA